MFKRRFIPVWLGILVFSGMFLVGQDAWPPPPECTADEDCDDGNGCTDDACLDQACVHTNNTNPCDDSDTCTMDDYCVDGACTGEPLDGDGDTYINDACGGDDCLDSNANVYPGAPEICDTVDNQCPGDPGYGEVDEDCVLVSVPGGCFDMGDAFSEGAADERPVHEVCITAFQMDPHEVTNSQYRECVLDGGCTEPSVTTIQPFGLDPIEYYTDPAYDAHPVVYVDWYQASAYCAWAGGRLPTEAEWEYAARGGLEGNRYAVGDTIDCGQSAFDRYWSVGECYEEGSPAHNFPQAVLSFSSNGYGLYDMAGNVSEWVNDIYGALYYGSSPVNDPPGPSTGAFRVIRGGSWSEARTTLLRVADRANRIPNPSLDSFNLGFRCAVGGAYGP